MTDLFKICPTCGEKTVSFIHDLSVRPIKYYCPECLPNRETPVIEVVRKMNRTAASPEGLASYPLEERLRDARGERKIQ